MSHFTSHPSIHSSSSCIIFKWRGQQNKQRGNKETNVTIKENKKQKLKENKRVKNIFIEIRKKIVLVLNK